MSTRPHQGHLQLRLVKSRQQPFASAEVGYHSATICHLLNISMQLDRKALWDQRKEVTNNQWPIPCSPVPCALATNAMPSPKAFCARLFISRNEPVDLNRTPTDLDFEKDKIDQQWVSGIFLLNDVKEFDMTTIPDRS
jgi:hypothetical protein